MSYLDVLASNGKALGITPGATSYFSEPSQTLDPKLFSNGENLSPWVKDGVLGILFEYLGTHFNSANRWTHAWLAGSGVSYQWEAARDPGDLDCLVGIDYVAFRASNPNYVGMSDIEISKMFNEDFSKLIMPKTSDWHGYELTYYVNPQTDIKNINPYAAYDLINDSWEVRPSRDSAPPYSRTWDAHVQRDTELGTKIINRYSQALSQIKSASNPAYRLNAETVMKEAVSQGVALFDEIHSGRKLAFSKTGGGYSDFHNYRWQAGKKSGIISALRKLKDIHTAAETQTSLDTYGIELPSSTDLIRRTVTPGAV